LTFVLFALGIVGTGLLAVPVLAGSAAYCVSEAFGWPARGESAGCCRVLQHHCRRHRGGTRARLYANRSHPNADLERRAQWYCRCSDHGGHDGGRYAPFGDGSFQRPADTHFLWMGWHSADGCYCCGTVLVLDWLSRTLSRVLTAK
jgi:hypothetical protein